MILETEEVLICSMESDPGAAIFIFKSAQQCKKCGRMMMMAVNRAGETLCLGCDEIPKA